MNKPSKRKGDFDEHQLELEKRLRVGAGALAAMSRKKQQEASLFAADMFGSNENKRKLVAAKETFNDGSANNLQRAMRRAQSVTPTKPESVDPEVLNNHIASLEELHKKQHEVSSFAGTGVFLP